ncbi:hypothetical protein [Laribacter hongkongensis]|uniref:hypothetical protein n=1 Tax=Laribacter hongkongensis TaxID=168471 RepID=UPI001EFCD675|nr:hypothetical protein [Laribacter hongkongensis]MCG9033356.1 hypothetical protein [Laribacter hongkongensis]MCG9093429.1 hypothetical protein [Laribacter hongkongensis]
MINSINTHAITTTSSTTANVTCATRTKRRDGRSLKVTPLDVSKALLVWMSPLKHRTPVPT